ncbi:alanine--glyoxylate aminotransferase 2, mitochondrial-like [Ciona intestinalis]
MHRTLRLVGHARRAASSIAVPQMPACDVTPEPYKGRSYEETMKIKKSNIAPTKVPAYSKPLLLTQGKMQWLWDDEGRRYLDMFAGIVTVSVGHCHPTVVGGLKEQLDKIWHTTNLYLTPPMHEYAEKLTSTLPDHLKVCFFTNSGSEANDLAIALARQYTSSFDVISFRNAYHGGSPYSVGLTAHGTWKHSYANGFGIHHSMNPDPYQGVWGGSKCRDSLVQTDRQCGCVGECEAGERYLEQLREVLDYSVGGKPAALFAEPIQGVGGVVQFPKNFLKKAYDLVHERGGLCVSDEVQTGFGRLGSHMWGFETHGVTPDIVTMAKGIANGFPMGAVVTTKEIAQAFTGTLHLNTFAGNPLACTVASKVLDVIQGEDTMGLCDRVGERLIRGLATLRDEFSIVGDVRGKGLMLGVEMVQDKGSRAPLSGPDMLEIWDNMKSMGLIVGKGGLRGNTFRLKPPMCITEEDADFTLGVMKKSISDFVNK